MSRVIEVRDLWKIYPGGTRALRGVNLTVERGEFIGVMGPSGSGKSTLLHILGGLDKPTKGRVMVFKNDIGSMSEDELALFRRSRIAYIFQFYYLLEDFTVIENLTIIGRLLGMNDPEKKATRLLEFLRLSHRLNHRPGQLSGGEQQRVAIGRALMGEPALILADEPTGNVDHEEGERIFELFKKLNEEQGITFLVATHNPDLKKFFTRIINLRDGELVE